jgi:hypothetical protein
MQVGMELDFIAGVMTNYKTDISNNLFKEIDAILGYKTLLDSPGSSSVRLPSFTATCADYFIYRVSVG